MYMSMTVYVRMFVCITTEPFDCLYILKNKRTKERRNSLLAVTSVS